MILTGKLVVLRDDWRPQDAEDLYRWLNLEEWNYCDEPDAPFEPPTCTVDEYVEGRRRWYETAHADGHNWQVDALAGEHIGFANYYDLKRKERRALVGICLPEPWNWNRGYGTEAVRLVTGYLFHDLRLAEVRTATWSGNRRMMRCAAKCGFTEVSRGPHRAPVSVRGEPLERVEFAITREEWLGSQ